jgi:hypothetical protein
VDLYLRETWSNVLVLASLETGVGGVSLLLVFSGSVSQKAGISVSRNGNRGSPRFEKKSG